MPSWTTPLIAIGALRQNRMRTLLTMLGMIMGVTAVIITVSLGAGAKAQVRARIDKLGRNVILVMAGSSSRGGSQGGLGSAGTLTVQDTLALRRDLPELAAVSPDQRSSAQVVAGNRNWSTTILGEGTEYLGIRQWALTRGTPFTQRDVDGLAKVALIGSTAARELFGDQDPVGQTVRIADVPFTLIGQLATKGNSLMGDDQDDAMIIPYTSLMKRLQGTTVLRGVMAQATAPETLAIAQEKITALLRTRHRIQPGQSDDFMVRTQQEIAATATATSSIMTVLLAAVASVSLAVGGIGIMNIMLVSVTERTREIGLRRALGAKRQDVLLQFLAEAMTLSLLGGGAGILTGLAGSQALAALTHWPIATSPAAIAAAFLFSAGVGVFFGFYPARKAAGLDPIEALRYE